MIISPQRKFVFVHIPKTGGTSLSIALEEKAAKDDILIGDTPKAVKRRNRVKKLSAKGRLWKHSKLSDIEGVITRDDMRQFKVFAITRNPWDRFVSYFHWLQSQKFDHPAVKLAKELSFADFLGHPVNLRAIQNDQVSDYLSDPSGHDCRDLVLRLEHMGEDLAKLVTLLGFSVSKIPHENRSDRPRDYRGFYGDKEAAIIAQAYRDDIKTFGYTF